MKLNNKVLLTIVSLLFFSSIYAQTKVLFYTNNGNFTVELSDKLAPITTKNFKDLIGKKFYDGIIFHRVIDNFMIQGGDPTGTGEGGSGDVIKDEFHEELSNVKATISMANAGPNTGDSQFFINLKDNTYLDFNKPPEESKHPVFGKVVSNFEVVERIGKVATNNDDKPLEDVIMDSLRIESPVGLDISQNSATIVKTSPNPITNRSTIKLGVKSSQNLQFRLFDSLGKIIASSTIKVSEGNNSISLNKIVSYNTLSKGIYQLNISGPGISAQQKLIIQ